MTYATAMPGITARLASVAGLGTLDQGGPGERPAVIEGEPTSVDACPLVYYLFQSGETIAPGQLSGMKYVVMIRVLVPWADNPGSEADIAPFVNSIPAAFDAKQHDGDGHSFAKLGGLVDLALITAINSGEDQGFHTVASVPYRSITYELTIKENKPNG
jgi:hypothetical protein